MIYMYFQICRKEYLSILRNSNLIYFDIIEVEASLQLEWETKIVEHTIYTLYIYECHYIDDAAQPPPPPIHVPVIK